MIPMQFDLFTGEAAPAPDLELDDRTAYILEQCKESRNDDRILFLEFWRIWDRLEKVIGEEAYAKLFTWMLKEATHFESIRRSRQRHQKLGGSYGHFLPDPEIAEYRRARDGAGPPRR